MPKLSQLCKSPPILSDSCKPVPIRAPKAAARKLRKVFKVLKPVLIGFLLGLLLVGYARLSAPAADDGPQLTGVGVNNNRGAAFRHVLINLPAFPLRTAILY